MPRPAPVSPEPPAAGSARTPRGQAVVYVVLLCLRELADAAGTALKDDMAAPALTPNEIESLAGNVRARLDDALPYAAAALPSGAVHAVTDALRSAARGIQQLPRPRSMPGRRWRRMLPKRPATSTRWPTGCTGTFPARTNCGASIRK